MVSPFGLLARVIGLLTLPQSSPNSYVAQVHVHHDRITRQQEVSGCYMWTERGRVKIILSTKPMPVVSWQAEQRAHVAWSLSLIYGFFLRGVILPGHTETIEQIN